MKISDLIFILLLLLSTASLLSSLENQTKNKGGLFYRAPGMSRDLIPRTLLFLLCSVGFLPPLARAIWLDLSSVDMKCLSEEIPINILVVGDYAVVHDDWDHDLPTISAKVTSPFGNNLHYQKNVESGQFAFTTPEAGSYLACFWVDGHNKGITSSVNLEWKIGIAARDWLSVARREKIEGVELELRKLEGAVEAIHENLLYLKNREAEMRTVNELTNSRVALFSIMSLGMCIGVSAFQLWHLRGYFEKKKLI